MSSGWLSLKELTKTAQRMLNEKAGVRLCPLCKNELKYLEGHSTGPLHTWCEHCDMCPDCEDGSV